MHANDVQPTYYTGAKCGSSCYTRGLSENYIFQYCFVVLTHKKKVDFL